MKVDDSSSFRKLRLAFRYLDAINFAGVARRYFATNLFDGILTALGLVLGYYFADGQRIDTLIASALAASFGLGLSGFVGSFLAEVAEREKEIIELEKALLKKLDGTVFSYAYGLAALFSALMNAVAPALGSLAVIAPLLLVSAMGLQTAVTFSVLASFTALLTLGAYLARGSGANMVKYAVAMACTGLAVAGVTILLGSLGG